MAKIAQTRFPDPPDQYDPRPFAELTRQLEQLVLQLNSSYQEDNKNEILRRTSFLQGDGGGQGGVDLSDLSVSTGSASGGGTLAYNNTTGVFTFSPAVTANRLNQVIHASTVTQVTSTTGSQVDTGLTADITPTATSSKIIITLAQIFGKNANNTQVDAYLYRDSTTIVSEWLNDDIRTGDGTTLFPGHSGFVWYDNPNTTSAVTYKTTFRNAAATGSVFAQGNNARSSILLMEVLQ